MHDAAIPQATALRLTSGSSRHYAQMSAQNRLADRGGDAMKVLAADDDSGIRQMIRRVLMADLRADVDEAPDGVNVLAALQASTFDLLVMDIEMRPLDGLDTLEAIRKVPSMRALPSRDDHGQRRCVAGVASAGARRERHRGEARLAVRPARPAAPGAVALRHAVDHAGAGFTIVGRCGTAIA